MVGDTHKHFQQKKMPYRQRGPLQGSIFLLQSLSWQRLNPCWLAVLTASAFNWLVSDNDYCNKEPEKSHQNKKHLHSDRPITFCLHYIGVIFIFKVASKCKTAKPLLYTVYKTRNWKQLGRKWSGKEVKFWRGSEKSQRIKVTTDVRWQTVPEAASSHRTRTIADNGQPCMSDH